MPGNNELISKDAAKKKMKSFFINEHETYNNIIKTKDKQDIEYDYTKIVFDIYKEILKREPDIGNAKYYANQLKFKIITEDKLREILKGSENYKETSMRTNKEEFDNQKTSIFNSKSNICTNTLELVYCMIGGNRLNEIKPYLEDVLPYIDKLVYIDSYSTDGSSDYLKELASTSNKVVLIQKEWQDRFSGFRNYYLDYLKETNYCGWVVTSDSISGERCTTILNEKGLIEVIPFEELFDRYSKIISPIINENNKEVITNPPIQVLSSTNPKIFKVDKIQDLINYPDDMYYLLSDKQLEVLLLYKEGNGYKNIGQKLNIPWDNARTILRTLRDKKEFISIKSEWCNVKKIIRHKTNKELIQINTKYGGTCVTEDHSLIKIKDIKYEKITPNEFINDNKHFVSINYIENNKKLSKIDLWEYLTKKENFNVDNDYISYYRGYKGKLPKIRRYYEKENIKILCQILGIFISEGSTVNPKNREFGPLFSIANSNKEWLEETKFNIEKITEDCKFKYNEDKSVEHLRTYQKLIVEVFEDLCGDDSSTKKIPNFIYNIEEEYQKVFTDNLIKGDGWKNKDYFIEQGNSEKYAENRFQYTTTSLKLASGISALLKIMKVNHSIHYGENSRGIKYYNILYKMTYKEKDDTRNISLRMKLEGKNTALHEIYVYDLEVENSNIFTDSLGSVLLHNTDEQFPEETLTQLRTLLNNSKDGTLYSGVKFRVEDVLVDDDDRNVTKSKIINKDYHKALLFKFIPDLRYEGEPHETLTSSSEKIKWIISDLLYQHIRSQLHIYVRSAENFFISNSNRYSEKWSDFRWLCTNNKILSFKDYWTLFEKHNLPQEIEEWITKHKDDNENTGDSEVREMYLLYNEILPKRKVIKELKSCAKEEKVILSHQAQKEIEEPKYDYQKTPDVQAGTFNNLMTLPEIKVQTNILTFPKNFIYELSNKYCESCGSYEGLTKFTIHGYSLEMCKECWLVLADYIKKKVEEIQ